MLLSNAGRAVSRCSQRIKRSVSEEICATSQSVFHDVITAISWIPCRMSSPKDRGEGGGRERESASKPVYITRFDFKYSKLSGEYESSGL